MDDADRAEKAAQWMHEDDLFHSRRPEGPRPKVASLCLWCEEVIEVIEPTEDDFHVEGVVTGMMRKLRF